MEETVQPTKVDYALKADSGLITFIILRDLTKPLIRLEGVIKDPKERLDPKNPYTHFREASWDEALNLAAKKFMKTY